MLCTLLAACGTPVARMQSPAPSVQPSAPEKRAEGAESAAPTLQAPGLVALPSSAQVEAAVPRGRPDPFAALPLPAASATAGGAQAEPATSGSAPILSLQGVLAVGGQLQALITTDAGSGAVCVGTRGRCFAESAPLLPPDWSVRAIDLRRGCLTYAVGAKLQPPVCMT
ncbi:hypothetical protein CWE17_02765 [Synechococcus sp. BS56D]|nr:hypothetical protein CWE17_02765 [Synechococcus sp. BS56D]